MKIATKITMTSLVLCVVLTSFHGKLAAKGSDSTQILSTTKAYVNATSTASKYKLEIFKKTKEWAIVSVIPVPEGRYEGAGVVLEKVDNKWIVRDMGTDLSEYDSKFK